MTSITYDAYKQRRIQLKRQITLFSKCLRSPNVDIDLVRLRMEALQLMYKDFSVMGIPEEVLDEPTDQFEEAENLFFESVAHAQRICGPQEVAISPPSSTASASAESNYVKLPRIPLPTFNGDLEGWLTFHDSFESLIHGNDAIPNIQKFQYLQSAVTDKAAEVIDNIPITADNYSVAWLALKNRFDNKRLITDTFLQNMFTLEKVDSLGNLRNFNDSFLKYVRALEVLNQPTRDSLLIFLYLSKLDVQTREKWEEQSQALEFPSLDDLTNFVQARCTILETTPELMNKVVKPKRTNIHVATPSYDSANCYKCKQAHYISKCPAFLALSPENRAKEVKRLKICLNCLKPNHNFKYCPSGNCKKCGGKHNTLVHFSNGSPATVVPTLSSDSTSGAPSNIQTDRPMSYVAADSAGYVLLNTAVVNVMARDGTMHPCRVLLDTGSQTHFVTHKLAKRLNLNLLATSSPIAGIGSHTTAVKFKTNVSIKSRFSPFRQDFSCLVLDQITGNMPAMDIDISAANIPKHIRLADPNFNKSAPIDMLMGSDLFWQSMESKRLNLNASLFAQQTHFGWVICGSIPNASLPRSTCHVSTDLNESLRRFWEIETLPESRTPTRSEQYCEDFFKNTISFKDGQFLARLPFNNKISELGSNYNSALKQFYSLERRLAANRQLKDEYCEFMRTYEQLGHMTANSHNRPTYFLPHHGVLKSSSTTTKLRVVFNASSKSDSGLSLNDTLIVGPVVQDDLLHVLMRFRTHKYALTADIEKMYRQVNVHPSDRVYQNILWRFSPDEEVRSYVLNTITYGTASASFLATRCLQEAAKMEANDFPAASQVALRDFYVDDLLTGADSIEALMALKKDLTLMLKRRGFNLRKWKGSVDQLRQDKSIPMANLKEDPDEELKTLGLIWSTVEDSFSFSSALVPPSGTLTKRHLLGCIARTFDPLGMVSPVIVTAKIIMQQLWQSGIGWDDAVPQPIKESWLEYQSQLSILNNISIPRNTLNGCQTVNLFGFSDASEAAYGACIYVRSADCNGQSNLFFAKSRVAPIKKLTLPRLELCGALLLAQALDLIKPIFKSIKKVQLYTDSTVVLGWLKGDPTTYKTFVANRVTQILNATEDCTWNHIKGTENPADLLTRGVTCRQLKEASLWWHGPDLKNVHSSAQTFTPHDELPELKSVKPTVCLLKVQDPFPIGRFSSFSKLRRICAYCTRFIRNCKLPPSQRVKGPLSSDEIFVATQTLIRLVQLQEFATDIDYLKKHGIVSSCSKLKALSPIYDNGILRVGGRLREAHIPYEQRHPAILPSNHHLTKLIVYFEHLRHLHGGPQSVLAAIRTKYWPINGRNVVKGILRSCVRCCRTNPLSISPIMGQLPGARVQPSRAFLNSGVDFCGPFFIKPRRRGNQIIKSYVAIFVCMATKAVHIELVGDLTSESFLGALRRFVSRRGLVTNLYSDNGTNFRGAYNEMRELRRLFLDEVHLAALQSMLAETSITWHFIPAHSPHFGGLWEAAVKSAKRHLRRVAGNASLTHEELITILAQVEACLNSRPMVPLSDDPSDLLVLTPGHFLVGGPLTAIPEPTLLDSRENTLSRWQRVQQILQHFWKRWSVDYLTSLQKKSKWTSSCGQILSEGDLVVVKSDNLPPLRWKLGRVVKLYRGADDIVRVIDVNTGNHVSKIAVRRICKLPVNS